MGEAHVSEAKLNPISAQRKLFAAGFRVARLGL
jgi:hypothetical protein